MLFKMMFFIIQKYQKDPIQKFKKLILGSLYIKYTYYTYYKYIYYAIFFAIQIHYQWMKLYFQILFAK